MIADIKQKEALLAKAVPSAMSLRWLSAISGIATGDTVIDLQFDGSAERIAALTAADSPLCIVHSVLNTCSSLPANFVRINAWPGFGQHSVIEAACGNTALQSTATAALATLGLQPKWVADIPGFLSARVVAMIINEAFYTLQEEVSTREAIDTAMKLGTNYPYGPFEWCSMIGAEHVFALLSLLAKTEKRYTPAEGLQKEATQS